MTNEELKRVKHRLEAENSKILNSNKLLYYFRLKTTQVVFLIAIFIKIGFEKNVISIYRCNRPGGEVKEGSKEEICRHSNQ